MIFLYLVAHKNRYPQFSWSGSKNEVESNTQEVTEPVLFVCFFFALGLQWKDDTFKEVTWTSAWDLSTPALSTFTRTSLRNDQERLQRGRFQRIDYVTERRRWETPQGSTRGFKRHGAGPVRALSSAESAVRRCSMDPSITAMVLPATFVYLLYCYVLFK